MNKVDLSSQLEQLKTMDELQDELGLFVTDDQLRSDYFSNKLSITEDQYKFS